MTGFELSRQWFDFAFENPDKIKPGHGILYFFIIEHCNRLGWKNKFGLPTSMAKEAIGIRSYNTYIQMLNDLIEWGFIDMVEKSKNQYSSNIIALSKNDKAQDKALDKALIKHSTKHMSKQSESTVQSIDSIDKPVTSNKEPVTKNNKPILMSEADASDVSEVNRDYFILAEAFYKVFQKNSQLLNVTWNHLEKISAEKFIDQIRFIKTIDKRTDEDLRVVYHFLQKDEFWMKNIQSSKKLREKFDQLITKAKNNGQSITKTRKSFSSQAAQYLATNDPDWKTY